MDGNRICQHPECERPLNAGGKYCSLSCANSVAGRRRAALIKATYDSAPRLCSNPECAAALAFDQRYNRFCSTRCSAIETQRKRGNRTGTGSVVYRLCEFCAAMTTNPRYCTERCSHAHRRAIFDESVFRRDGVGFTPRALRQYLLNRCDHACRICGVEEWLGEPVPLVMDHIDGNPENDSLQNLRLICPNCDATLPTYKSRNRGNGRVWRRERYRAGQSY
jgi:hypothetical protein